mmetsp:Transcript_4163/g.11340  ORF Transcript_4163/g.11340 Transcript_4163/m.11340 type:complete len:362 (-) Transcript_4163:12-1097(-)
MCADTSHASHAESRQGELSVQSVIPGNFVFGMNISVGVKRVEDFESRLFQGINNILRSGQGGKTVSDFDTFLNSQMVLVVLVESTFWQDNPFHTNKHTSLLQGAADTREALDTIGGMASGLNFIGNIIRVGFKDVFQLLEISLHQAALVGDTLLRAVLVSNLDLVFVDGHTGDIGSGELLNVAHGSAHTTANVNGLGLFVHASPGGHVVLQTLDGFLERFTLLAGSKVEGLTPAIFVKIGHQVVERVDHGIVLLLALFNGFLLVKTSNILAGTFKQVIVSIHGILDFFTLQYRVRVGQQVHPTRDNVSKRVTNAVALEGARQSEDDIDAQDENNCSGQEGRCNAGGGRDGFKCRFQAHGRK